MRTVGLVRVCLDYSNKSGAFLSRARSYQALPEDWGLFLTLGLCWKLFLHRTWAFMAAVDTFWKASTCVFDCAAPACVLEGKRGFPKIWVENLLCLLCSALFCCAAVSWKWSNDQISKGLRFCLLTRTSPIRYHLKSPSSIWFRNNPSFSVFWSMLKAENEKHCNRLCWMHNMDDAYKRREKVRLICETYGYGRGRVRDHNVQSLGIPIPFQRGLTWWLCSWKLLR